MRAYPHIRFDQPVSIVATPDHTWWFVAERRGRVWRIAANDEQTPAAELVLDLSAKVNASFHGIGLLAIAVHPDFARTGALFVSYTGHGGTLATSRVSRYASSDGGRTFERQHDLIELDQIADYHVNTDLRFGPDGYLYIGFGDGGPQGDPHGRAQDPYSLKGKILRVDVDAKQPYAIPADNPFAAGGGAPEVWALGLRNPWRFSFDRETGELWAGDVGEDHFEEVDRIVRGGNYGWPAWEANRCVTPACKRVAALPPIAALPHPLVSSVTFGVAYRGSALPELRGHLIYADYASGVLWEVDPNAPTPRRIHDGGHPIVAFGEDAAGEPMLVDLDGTLWRLVPGQAGPADVPARLSETGCFGRRGEAAPGLIPYEINVPFWSDGSVKRRWLAIPDGAKAGIAKDGTLELPIGSVVAKEFSIGGLRVETRLLARHDDGGWGGYTYRWDVDQTDATLIAAMGKGERIEFPAPWYYPHRGECSRCHQGAAGHTLGLEVAQLSRPIMHAAGSEDQLAALSRIGVLATPPPGVVPLAANDSGGSLDQRARAWLHVNCAYCHRPGGNGQGDMDLRSTTPLAQMNICDAPPKMGEFGRPGSRIVAPGDPWRSLLLRRIRSRGFIRMPPLATTGVIDEQGAAMIQEWIGQLRCD